MTKTFYHMELTYTDGTLIKFEVEALSEEIAIYLAARKSRATYRSIKGGKLSKIQILESKTITI